MKPNQIPRLLTLFFCAAYLLSMSSILLLDDPRLRFPRYVLFQMLAWVGILGAIKTAHLPRHTFTWVVIGLVFRIWAWYEPPAFSEDVFRYIYEGRVMLQHGIQFPFAHPPAAAPNLGVPTEFLDEAWLRINHPELATIYPPLALLLFAGSATVGNIIGGNYLFILKTSLLAADIFTWRLLHQKNPSMAFLWGLSPLVIFEIAREAHVDALSACGLAIGATSFAAGRAKLGLIGWLIAAGAKLNGLLLIPATLRRTREGAWLLIPGLLIIMIPYVFFSEQDTSGLSAYATRWRSGDGAYSLFLFASETLIGGDWTRVSDFTITRHQLARALVIVTLGGIYTWILIRSDVGLQNPRTGLSASIQTLASTAGFLLLCTLLLSPTLHPWYILWLIPFVAIGPFCGRNAAIWLIVTAPLLHHPGWLELVDGQWRNLPLVQALIHVPAWINLLWDISRLELSGKPS